MNINEILDLIERGLDGVAPGPYTFSGIRYKMNGAEWQSIFDGQDRPIVAVSIDPHTLDGFKDGKHLSRCDPDTMRAIIDAYRQMEARAEKAEAKVARLKTALRVNMLRYGPPGYDHKTIDAMIDAVMDETQ